MRHLHLPTSVPFIVVIALLALLAGCQKERIGPAHHALYVFAGDGAQAEPKGGRIAVTTKGGDVHTIRGTFRLVWEQADGTKTLGAILQDLQGRFPDQPPQRIEGDLHNFMTQMVDLEVLALRTEPAPAPGPAADPAAATPAPAPAPSPPG